MLSSVFLIKIFDLRLKELKYEKELLLNHNRKSVKNFMRLKCFGGVKTAVTNHLREVFLSRIHKAVERNTAARMIWDYLIKTNS